MIKEFWNRINELVAQNFYILPHWLQVIWQMVSAFLVLLLSLSIFNFIYKYHRQTKSGIIRFIRKINELFKALDFKKFIYSSKKLYRDNIPKLAFIETEFKNKKIGGLNALIQTNWQFKKKKGKKYVIREPEEIGLREVLDENSLVSLALANWIEITEIYLCTTVEKDGLSYYVDLKFKNLTGKPILISVPKGQVFENEDINSKTQNLAAKEQYTCSITKEISHRMKIPTYCLNETMGPPDGKTGKVTIFEVLSKDFANQSQLWRLIERQNLLVEADGFQSDFKLDLIKAVINASHQLQGLCKTMQADEDARNGFIASVLNNKGFKAKDQSRWGVSEKGGRTGEIDIKIDADDNNTLAICEAFRIQGKNTSVITTHLKKIFGYDVNGLKRNFIIVYAETPDYLQLWETYLEIAQAVEYPYPLKGNISDVSLKHSKYSDIKIGLGIHQRSGSLTELYHIFINMHSTK
jgi:hypothetical protein